MVTLEVKLMYHPYARQTATVKVKSEIYGLAAIVEVAIPLFLQVQNF